MRVWTCDVCACGCVMCVCMCRCGMCVCACHVGVCAMCVLYVHMRVRVCVCVFESLPIKGGGRELVRCTLSQ